MVERYGSHCDSRFLLRSLGRRRHGAPPCSGPTLALDMSSLEQSTDVALLLKTLEASVAELLQQRLAGHLLFLR